MEIRMVAKVINNFTHWKGRQNYHWESNMSVEKNFVYHLNDCLALVGCQTKMYLSKAIPRMRKHCEYCGISLEITLAIYTSKEMSDMPFG